MDANRSKPTDVRNRGEKSNVVITVFSSEAIRFWDKSFRLAAGSSCGPRGQPQLQDVVGLEKFQGFIQNNAR
jgi:hypothetical protein